MIFARMMTITGLGLLALASPVRAEHAAHESRSSMNRRHDAERRALHDAREQRLDQLRHVFHERRDAMQDRWKCHRDHLRGHARSDYDRSYHRQRQAFEKHYHADVREVHQWFSDQHKALNRQHDYERRLWDQRERERRAFRPAPGAHHDGGVCLLGDGQFTAGPPPRFADGRDGHGYDRHDDHRDHVGHDERGRVERGRLEQDHRDARDRFGRQPGQFGDERFDRGGFERETRYRMPAPQFPHRDAGYPAGRVEPFGQAAPPAIQLGGMLLQHFLGR